MKISICVMAHPKRADNANVLLKRIHNQGFYSSSIVFDSNNNEWDNGVAALKAHTDSDYHVVIQDDAIIGKDFFKNVARALEMAPTHSLMSFYTGTVRPFPKRVSTAVAVAENIGASYIKFDRLMWGVCFAIPTKDIELMLNYVKGSTIPFDQRIGLFYNRFNMPVYYTHPSLVDHNYTLGSIIGNDYSPEPRKAHRFEPNEVMKWTERTVEV